MVFLNLEILILIKVQSNLKSFEGYDIIYTDFISSKNFNFNKNYKNIIYILNDVSWLNMVKYTSINSLFILNNPVFNLNNIVNPYKEYALVNLKEQIIKNIKQSDSKDLYHLYNNITDNFDQLIDKQWDISNNTIVYYSNNNIISKDPPLILENKIHEDPENNNILLLNKYLAPYQNHDQGLINIINNLINN